MKHKNVKRITLDVSTEFNDRLDRLLEMVDASNKAELIRQALRVYEYIVKQTLEGNNFKIERKNGEIERMTFFEIPQPTEN